MSSFHLPVLDYGILATGTFPHISTEQQQHVQAGTAGAMSHTAKRWLAVLAMQRSKDSA